MKWIPPWQDEGVIHHSVRLCQSFYHWTGRSLLPDHYPTDQALGEALFTFPQPVLSHGTEPDPLLNYGNQATLDLWQLDWQTLRQMPSRLTAEPISRAERQQRLAQAAAQGYTENYSGVRISTTGQRFQIENACIWVVLDEQGQPIGQAATFKDWRFLP